MRLSLVFNVLTFRRLMSQLQRIRQIHRCSLSSLAITHTVTSCCYVVWFIGTTLHRLRAETVAMDTAACWTSSRVMYRCDRRLQTIIWYQRWQLLKVKNPNDYTRGSEVHHAGISR